MRCERVVAAERCGLARFGPETPAGSSTSSTLVVGSMRASAPESDAGPLDQTRRSGSVTSTPTRVWRLAAEAFALLLRNDHERRASGRELLEHGARRKISTVW